MKTAISVMETVSTIPSYLSHLRTRIKVPKKIKRITAGCIIINPTLDGLYVAMIRNKWSRKWGFPKGGVESNESLKMAAEREFIEETGLDISIPIDSQPYRINKTTYFIKVVEKKQKMHPRDLNEIMDSSWMNINKLPNIHDLFTRDVRIFKELRKGALKTFLENIEKHNFSEFKIKTDCNNKRKDGNKCGFIQTIESSSGEGQCYYG